MDYRLELFIVAFASIGASSGFWAYLMKKDTDRGATTQLLLGLAHYRIVELGVTYINRGFITKGEYEDYIKYFCDPYIKLGGNGLVSKVIVDVEALPITYGLHSYKVPIKEKKGEKDG